MEIEELQRLELIKPQGRNRRHDLFLKIKYPDTVFYRGGWGPEILHFQDQGPYLGRVGRVFTTYGRYTLISQWFLWAMSQ